MKINFKIGFYLFAFLTTLFLGCTKEVILIEPDPYGHARVLNTDIPVPYATLAYLKRDNPGFMGIATFIVLKRDTADANGDFLIDYSLGADFVAARYDSVIYDYSYEENYLDLAYAESSKNIASIPGNCWVGVTCLDVPPLNPEITTVFWSDGSMYGTVLNEEVPAFRIVPAEELVSISYLLYSGNTYEGSESDQYTFPFNDTTYVVVKY